MRPGRIFSMVMFCCLFYGTAQAFDWERIRLNGFVSQGYLESSGNNFLADSEDGTTQFNEVGLAVNTTVTDKLRIGAQLLSRDLGTVGNNEVRLDWGFGDYSFRDYLGVRVGKIKLPMGLYNEGRDVDVLRPMVFLPQSIYNENERDMLVAYQGAGVYGNVPMNSLGNLDYHLFYGTTNMPDDAQMMDLLRESFSRISMGQGEVGVAKVMEDDSVLYGGSLVYNTPVEGLRAGVSYFSSENNFEVELVDLSTAEGKLDIEGQYVVSLEYTTPRFGISTEYKEEKSSKTFMGVSTAEKTSQAWYAMLTCFATDQLSFSLLYDLYYDDKNDKDGDQFTAMGLPDFMAWRKDFGLGVRYDVNPNWVLKAEYHEIRGVDPFAIVVNDPTDMKESWNYFALKSTFVF